MRQIIPVGFYLGVGALCHAFFIGPQFDWSNAWTWGWLFGWPMMLFISFWTVLLTIAAACLVAVLIYASYDHIRHARRKITIARERAKARNNGN